MRDHDPLGSFASPPCFMREVDPECLGLKPATDQGWRDVSFFRKAERERLIKERLAVSAEEREAKTALIADLLLAEIGAFNQRIISAYWPIRGEPDLRPLLKLVNASGGRTALPAVIEKKHPLEFRLWQQGEQLERGVWGIPVPVNREICIPDVIIAPLVGYDTNCFRLGYGGGFFDRTLAQLHNSPLVIGVGYSQAAINTIHPQQHDVPMDLIVTDSGVSRRSERMRSS